MPNASFPWVWHRQAVAEDFPSAPRMELATGERVGTAWGHGQQTGAKLHFCVSAALLCLLRLSAWGRSHPGHTHPCSLVLTPHQPDSSKSITSPFQPFLKKSGDAPQPLLHALLGAIPQEDPAAAAALLSCWQGLCQEGLSLGCFPQAPLPAAHCLESMWVAPNPQGCPGCAIELLACQAPACFCSRRAGERVREGQMVPLCPPALKHAAFFQKQ